MKKNLISIIVPVYNVEKYLKRCIESIINQTYQNLEIILVDDGSTDNSLKLCNYYKTKDKRIKVIHQSNRGLSSARNSGLKESNGDYICFVDSDDWINLNFVKVLFETSQNTNSQIVECKTKKVYDFKEEKDMESFQVYSFTGKNCFYEFIKGTYFKQTVWNKIYKRNIIEGMFFEDGKIHEDEFWSYQIFNRANKVTSIDFFGYYYFQRNGSIMNEIFTKKNLDGYYAKINRLNFVKEYYPEILQLELVNFLQSSIYFYGKVLFCEINKKNEILKKIKLEYNNSLRLVDYSVLSYKKILWFVIFAFMPKIYCRLNNFFNVI